MFYDKLGRVCAGSVTTAGVEVVLCVGVLQSQLRRGTVRGIVSHVFVVKLAVVHSWTHTLDIEDTL